MKYLDVIDSCKLKIENNFEEFTLGLKNSEFFSALNSRISSYSFINEFQLVDATLSFYVPELENFDEDGIDISIGLFQVRKTKNEITSYSSNIKYDEHGDLIFDKFLYVTSGICTTTGSFILQNIDYEINVDDVLTFDKELTKTIDCIFVSFNSNIDLITAKLLDLKNCT